MPRNITINFGLLSVAAQSDSAVIKAPEFANLCKGQPGKPAHEHKAVVAPSQCVECGPITDREVLDKGRKGVGGTITVLTQEELLAAKESYSAEFKGNLNLIPHPAEQFLPATGQGDSIHYLTPRDATAEGHYALLVRLIESHPELCFVSLHTPVSATAMFLVTVRAGVLVMEKRTREQSMKAIPSVGKAEVNEKLYAMLEGALPTFVADYDREEYEDRYVAAIDEMVADGLQIHMAKDGPTVTTAVPATDEDLIAKLATLTKRAAKPRERKAKAS